MGTDPIFREPKIHFYTFHVKLYIIREEEGEGVAVCRQETLGG